MKEIDAAKVAALCDVLKDALPALVEEALRARDCALPKIIADLSDAELGKLMREENQRRRKVASKLIWIEKSAPLDPPSHWWDFFPDCTRYEAEIGDGNPPYCIRERTINGKTFFIVSHGKRHYTSARSFEKAKNYAEANFAASIGGARLSGGSEKGATDRAKCTRCPGDAK